MIGFLRSRVGLVLLASLAIAGFFVVREHQVHLPGFLPLLLLGVFLLLHLFMHAGHGGHGGHAQHADRTGERRNGAAEDTEERPGGPHA